MSSTARKPQGRTHRPIWQEAEPLVDRTQGILISDDSAARSAHAQRNPIGWGLRAYVRLIWHGLETGATRFATKLAIIRPAVQQFLSDPSVTLAGFPQVGMDHKRSPA
jgi:hypothetical protein